MPTPWLTNLINPSVIVGFANQEISQANNYLVTLGQVTAGLTPPQITPVFPTVTNPPPITVAPPPALTPVIWTVPSTPTAFTGTLNIDSLLPAPFDGTPPTLNFGAAPAAFSELAPDAPGVTTNYTYPTLSLNLPSAPSLLTLNTYAFNGINLPTIDFTVPVLEAVAPSVTQYNPGALYTSGLLTALRSSLQDRIQNGGTGLNPAVEANIWNRGREREARSRADAILELDKMEALGYALPPGAYVDGRIKITTETQYASTTINREIMIKQAELEQSNVLAALTTATQIESKLIDYNNQVEQRLFDSAKYMTEAGIAVYNARVQAYVAFVDAYKAKVEIYKAQIQAETAKVDAYKAQVDAEKSKADINRTLVEQYKIQSDVALANIKVYEAEISAIQTKAEIEKTKIVIFGEQVKAYGAKINAYTASVEGYKATIGAETSKQEAFKSQVEAYSAKVTAAVKSAEAKIAQFEGYIKAKSVEWDGYKAAAAAEGERARAIASNNTSLFESYRAQVAGTSAYNDLLTKQWQVALDQAQRVAEIGIKTAEANAQLAITTRSLALDAAKVGAQVAAQLGAAALNAMHISQSMGESYSSSTSYSENRNYNYSV